MSEKTIWTWWRGDWHQGDTRILIAKRVRQLYWDWALAQAQGHALVHCF